MNSSASSGRNNLIVLSTIRPTSHWDCTPSLITSTFHNNLISKSIDSSYKNLRTLSASNHASLVDDFNQEISSRLPAKVLKDKDEIEIEINALQERDLRNSLYVVVYEKPKSSTAFTIKLAALMNTRPAIRAVIVILKNKENIDKNWFNQMDKNLDIYGTNQDKLDFRIKYVDKPIGTDMYIIERRHLVFNIANISRDPGRTVLIVEDAGVATTEFIAWFDREVYPDSIPYAQVKSNQPTSNGE